MGHIIFWPNVEIRITYHNSTQISTRLIVEIYFLNQTILSISKDININYLEQEESFRRKHDRKKSERKLKMKNLCIEKQ